MYLTAFFGKDVSVSVTLADEVGFWLVSFPDHIFRLA